MFGVIIHFPRKLDSLLLKWNTERPIWCWQISIQSLQNNLQSKNLINRWNKVYIPNTTLVWIIGFVYTWKWDWNRKWIDTIISLTFDEILEVLAFLIIVIFLQSCALKIAVPSRIHIWLISILRCWIFSCDQAALWMVFSVRLSVCHTFLTMFPSSYHHESVRGHHEGPW